MNEQTQTTQTTAKSTHSAQSLVTIALMAAGYCAYLLTSVFPCQTALTLQALNFIVMLVALVFSIRESFLINLIWFLLGLLGLPVLIGGASGIGYVLGPWGGYSIAFLIVAALVPLICTRQIQPCSLYHYRHSFCCFCRSVWQYLDDGCKRYCSGSCSCSRIPAIYRFGCGKSGDRSTDRTSDP